MFLDGNERTHRQPTFLERNDGLYYYYYYYRGVVSAGGRLTIYASPPGWTLRSFAGREQLGVIIGVNGSTTHSVR